MFHYQSLPSLRTEQGEPPLLVYCPLALGQQARQVRGLPGVWVPMVGRQAELTRLQEAFAEAGQHQRSQIALIAGEAGMGKSRLVAEFRRGLDGVVANVYEGQCLPYARATPFWLVNTLVRDIVQIDEADSVELQKYKVQSHLERLGIAGNDELSYLLSVLGLEEADPRAAARLRLLDAVMLQRQIHAAVRHLLTAAVGQAPTALIMEDLHWIDPASREFLVYLLRTIGDMPIFLILVARNLERKTALQPLLTVLDRTPDRLLSIQLGALSEQEGYHLAQQLLEQVTSTAQGLAGRIARRAEGVPFFIEEMIRVLIDPIRVGQSAVGTCPG